MTVDCIPAIVENVKRLGGIDEGRVAPRDITLSQPARSRWACLMIDRSVCGLPG